MKLSYFDFMNKHISDYSEFPSSHLFSSNKIQFILFENMFTCFPDSKQEHMKLNLINSPPNNQKLLKIPIKAKIKMIFIIVIILFYWSSFCKYLKRIYLNYLLSTDIVFLDC